MSLLSSVCGLNEYWTVFECGASRSGSKPLDSGTRSQQWHSKVSCGDIPAELSKRRACSSTTAYLGLSVRGWWMWVMCLTQEIQLISKPSDSRASGVLAFNVNGSGRSRAMCCCSVTQFCLTLCDLMDCCTPGFPVLHYLPVFAQTYGQWISDAIQPSRPLSSPSPPAFNFS